MYIPASFKVTDQVLAYSFIDRYDFATLITAPQSGDMLVSHIPLILKRSADHAVLLGHLARENEHWHYFDGAVKSMAIFHGPHAYISPSWYQNHPAVPTWNYAVVHAYGCPRVTEDPEVTSAVLESLVRKHEISRAHPWNTEGLPQDFYRQMVNRIVAFEMPIDKTESKFKLGQNRSREDRNGTVQGLLREGSPDAAALASFMQENAGPVESKP